MTVTILLAVATGAVAYLACRLYMERENPLHHLWALAAVVAVIILVYLGWGVFTGAIAIALNALVAVGIGIVLLSGGLAVLIIAFARRNASERASVPFLVGLALSASGAALLSGAHPGVFLISAAVGLIALYLLEKGKPGEIALYVIALVAIAVMVGSIALPAAGTIAHADLGGILANQARK